MSMRGVIYVPMMGICPDGWEYKFTGETLYVKEFFDGVTAAEMALTVQLFRQSGFEAEVSEQDGGVLISGQLDCSQNTAVKAVLGEAVTQAKLLALITGDMMLRFLDALIPSEKG